MVLLHLVGLVVGDRGLAHPWDLDLDTSFSGDGKVITNFTPREDYSRGVDIDGDGNVVVAGYAGYAEGGNTAFAVARYQSA
jgi:hypothetical protein